MLHRKNEINLNLRKFCNNFEKLLKLELIRKISFISIDILDIFKVWKKLVFGILIFQRDVSEQVAHGFFVVNSSDRL